MEGARSYMSKTYRILVIDDEPIYHKMISHALQPLGYEVEFALNAESGYLTAQSTNPDLIITDVIMEEMTGYELTQKLRRDSRFAQIPIIILTSQTELADKLKAFESGADDYISKPFAPPELIARIGVLLRRYEAVAKAAVPPVKLEEPRIITVHSLRGGVGCSSIAVNLASAIWELWQKPTLLIDSVLTAGQVALMLNISLKRTWGDIANYKPEEIDYDLLDTVISKHKSGLHVIAGPTTPAVAEMISVPSMKTAIDILRPYYEYIIIDTQHDFSEVTILMLDIADVIIQVMAPEMASIRAAVAAIDTYPQLGYDTDKVNLVLNRLFDQPGLEQQQIEKALSLPIKMVFPYAPDLFIRAINLGEPIIYDNPKSYVTSLLENLAYNISKKVHKTTPPTNPTPTWQRVNKRLTQKRRLMG